MRRQLAAFTAATGLGLAGVLAAAAPAAHAVDTPYFIQSAKYGTYIVGEGEGNRVNLSTSQTDFFETTTPPITYDGVVWYQWSYIDGYCLQDNGQGNANIILEPCKNIAAQFWYNNAAKNSQFLSLASTEIEGASWGVNAETGGGIAVDKLPSPLTSAYEWNFKPGV